MKNLFLFTISPVQSFIAQARKTKDLKMGSSLLSDLVRTAINIAESDYNMKIIFPFISDNQDDSSLPNRFLAICPQNDEDLKKTGQTIEIEVKLKLESWAKKALKNGQSNVLSKKFEMAFWEQIGSHLEIYWCFEPFDKADNYAAAYEQIEKNIRAIKNVRLFNQLPENENGRKCSISGDRDALIFGKFDLPSFVDETKICISDNIQFNKGEGLSAINYVKRFAKAGSFPSTADISLFKFEELIRKSGQEGLDTLDKYQNLFRIRNANNDFDGQLLYEENLTANYFKKHGLSNYLNEDGFVKANGRSLPNLLKAVLKYAKKQKPKINQTSYYALVAIDGDRMGKLLSGKLLDTATDLKKFHEELAKAQSAFSKWAEKYIDEPKGKTVYAGGDDYVGFINLDYLFECLQMLRSKFEELVNLPLQEEFSLKEPITMSAGVIIAHYKTPLGKVVEQGQMVLKNYAKENAGRDAFAIRVIKHSGEQQICWMKWQHDGTESLNLKKMKNLYEQLKKKLSNKFISVLSTELFQLAGLNSRLSDVKKELVSTEIKRTVTRAYEGSKKDTEILDAVDAVLNIESETHEVDNFIHSLAIIDFLKRETQPI